MCWQRVITDRTFCVCLCSNDAYLLEKNKPRPVPTSIIHAPLPTQQFGVDLELEVICIILVLMLVIGTAHIVCRAGCVQLSGFLLSIHSSVPLQLRTSSFDLMPQCHVFDCLNYSVPCLQPRNAADANLLILFLTGFFQVIPCWPQSFERETGQMPFIHFCL